MCFTEIAANPELKKLKKISSEIRAENDRMLYSGFGGSDTITPSPKMEKKHRLSSDQLANMLIRPNDEEKLLLELFRDEKRKSPAKIWDGAKAEVVKCMGPIEPGGLLNVLIDKTHNFSRANQMAKCWSTANQ
jgi:hypothetical protein